MKCLTTGKETKSNLFMNYELPFNAWIGYNLFVIHIAVLLILHSFEFKNVKKKKVIDTSTGELRIHSNKFSYIYNQLFILINLMHHRFTKIENEKDWQ